MLVEFDHDHVCCDGRRADGNRMISWRRGSAHGGGVTATRRSGSRRARALRTERGFSVTTSPTDAFSSAVAMGEIHETRPRSGSLSSMPTMLTVRSVAALVDDGDGRAEVHLLVRLAGVVDHLGGVDALIESECGDRSRAAGACRRCSRRSRSDRRCSPPTRWCRRASDGRPSRAGRARRAAAGSPAGVM